MFTLAWKNLIHDKTRLAVTLVGIVFALVLILVQFGLFLGFLDTSANVVEKSGADLWVSAPGIPHVNGGSPFKESRRWQALAVDGVERADPYALFFVNWKLASGSTEAVQIAGFDLEGRMGGPWNVTAGSVDDLHSEDTVIVDELYGEKLGVSQPGQSVEINGRRARVVGFTRGIRSFTTTPYIFTSFKNAQNYVPLAQDETVYLLIKLKAGAAADTVRAALAAKLPSLEVTTNDAMLHRTQNYWVFSTGAGVTTLLGAILGLIVGVVVVAQTIYSATVDHIREFGTLKAMGASNTRIYQVILAQAGMSGVMGYSLAIAIGWFVSRQSDGGNTPIELPAAVAVGIFALALLMCMGASVISIRKATTIDPAMVFRG